MRIVRIDLISIRKKERKREGKNGGKKRKHATRGVCDVAHNCIAMAVISISRFWVTRLKHDVVEYLIDPRGRVSRGGFDVRR